MSYISLLNEGESSANSSFVGATDYLTVGRALTNYGVFTQLGDANFTGANGINTTSMISSGIVQVLSYITNLRTGVKLRYDYRRNYQQILFIHPSPNRC